MRGVMDRLGHVHVSTAMVYQHSDQDIYESSSDDNRFKNKLIDAYKEIINEYKINILERND